MHAYATTITPAVCAGHSSTGGRKHSQVLMVRVTVLLCKSSNVQGSVLQFLQQCQLSNPNNGCVEINNAFQLHKLSNLC
jgi:hypothetical protein